MKIIYDTDRPHKEAGMIDLPMKMSKTIKGELRPPFEAVMLYGMYRIRIGKHWLVLDPSEKVSLTKQKEIAKWVAGIIKEQWEKDFGEPMRWIRLLGDFCKCPKCDEINLYPVCFCYCPDCGKRLLPPEEK